MLTPIQDSFCAWRGAAGKGSCSPGLVQPWVAAVLCCAEVLLHVLAELLQGGQLLGAAAAVGAVQQVGLSRVQENNINNNNTSSSGSSVQSKDGALQAAGSPQHACM
jgi:hypothetical protein